MLLPMTLTLAAITAGEPPGTPDVDVVIAAPDTGPPIAGGRERLVPPIEALLAELVDRHRLIRRPLDRAAARGFLRCLPLEAGRARDGCIAAALAPTAAAPRPVAILVETREWRSAAQQVTCIGPAGAHVGREAIHLADVDHPDDEVRQGGRRRMIACIRDALGRTDRKRDDELMER